MREAAEASARSAAKTASESGSVILSHTSSRHGWSLWRTLLRAENVLFTRARYSEPKMIAIGLVGALAMIGYYPVWRWLIPQPYENLWIRIAGCALFVILALLPWWPRRAKAWVPGYWYLVMTLSMPCFVGYMMLRNATPVWLMTHLVVVMMLIMLFDIASFIAVFVLGSVVAIVAFMLTVPGDLPWHALLDYVPMLLFAVVGGVACNVSQSVAEQARVDALTAASDNIAHEIRTPLGSIQIAAQAVRRFLPDLLYSHRLAQQADLPVTNLREPHLHALEQSLDVMVREVCHANTVIDMLLLAARPIGQPALELIAAHRCVEIALARYPYPSHAERQRVHLVTGADDFALVGSEVLLVHVIFNLLRNALYHTGRSGKGEILIYIEAQAMRGGRIRVYDDGPGIPVDVLPRIFDRFYSNVGGGVTGPGIGLAFSRSAMEYMGGCIDCRSRWHVFTEFTLTFPGVGKGSS